MLAWAHNHYKDVMDERRESELERLEQSKTAIFNHPTCMWHPYWGWSYWNFTNICDVI